MLDGIAHIGQRTPCVSTADVGSGSKADTGDQPESRHWHVGGLGKLPTYRRRAPSGDHGGQQHHPRRRWNRPVCCARCGGGGTGL